MFFIGNEGEGMRDGFRNYTDEEIAQEFLKIDKDQSYFITKNEWMAYFLGMYLKELEELDKEGPDSIMSKIRMLSDEFDKVDTDGSKEIDFYEFKEYVAKNVYISSL